MSRRRSSRGRLAERGTILFVAIGAVLILSILTLGVTSSVMQELRLARSVTRANEAFYAGRAAAEIARVVLALDDTPGVVVSYDLRTREVAFGTKRLKVALEDEGALIPLHTAPADVLARLPGLDNSFVAGNLATADIRTKEDALLVSGVTPEMYAQFAPFVTTFSGGAVNVNTAAPPALTALGMDQDLIESIQELRAGEDGQEGTRDDFWFLAPQTLVSDLRDNAGISDTEAALVTTLLQKQQLGTTSNFVSVRAFLVTGQREEEIARVVLNLASGKTAAWYEE
jgi:type II secretory pathway component PulK